MSSKAVQELLISLFNQAPIKKTLGLTLEYNENAEAIFRMPRNPNLDHGGHDTHGGVFATLLDSAGWFTVAAQTEKNVLTSDLHVRMLEAAKQQDLIATAKVVRLGSRTAVAEMKVTSPRGGLIAIGTGSFAVVGELPGKTA